MKKVAEVGIKPWSEKREVRSRAVSKQTSQKAGTSSYHKCN